MAKGIYYTQRDIRYFGHRKNTDPPGLRWQEVTQPDDRELLETYSIRELEWNGTNVVRRTQDVIDRMQRDRQLRGLRDRIADDPILQEILREIGLTPAELVRRVSTR